MRTIRMALSLAMVVGATHLLAVVPPASAQDSTEVAERLDDSEAEALDLWHRYSDGGSFLPALQHARQSRAARKLLEADSTNAVAHLVLGSLRMDLYRNQKDRVSIPVRYSDRNVMDLMIGYLDPRREDGRDLGIVRDTRLELSYAKEAEMHLRSAFRGLDGPLSEQAAVRLAELALLLDDAALGLEMARGIRARRPASTLGLELEVLFQMRSGNTAMAWRVAEEAMEMMEASDRSGILDRVPIERPSLMQLEGDWLDEDLSWETPENERLAEHMARHVASRLLGVDPDSDRGRLFIRYGLPDETVRFSSDRDDFMAVSYPYTTFIFHDMAKSGEWIFWSASAADLTGPRNVIRQWQRDQTIHAAEQFERTPARSGLSDRGTVPLHAAVYGFGPSGGREYVAVWCLADADAGDDEEADVGSSASIRHAGLYAANDSGVDSGFLNVPLPEIVSEWTPDENQGTAPSDTGFGCRPSVHTVRTDADPYRFSFEVRDSQGRRGAVRVRTAPVPPSGPVMSDLVLARLVAESARADESVPDGFFKRGDRLIEPLLPAVARAGDPVAVYFEVHGLGEPERGLEEGPTRTFEIEAVLAPTNQRDETTVAVSFTEEVPFGTWARDFILDLDGVKSGAYYLTVRVTDISGNLRAIERSTTLDIQSP